MSKEAVGQAMKEGLPPCGQQEEQSCSKGGGTTISPVGLQTTTNTTPVKGSMSDIIAEARKKRKAAIAASKRVAKSSTPPSSTQGAQSAFVDVIHPPPFKKDVVDMDVPFRPNFWVSESESALRDANVAWRLSAHMLPADEQVLSGKDIHTLALDTVHMSYMAQIHSAIMSKRYLENVKALKDIKRELDGTKVALAQSRLDADMRVRMVTQEYEEKIRRTTEEAVAKYKASVEYKELVSCAATSFVMGFDMAIQLVKEDFPNLDLKKYDEIPIGGPSSTSPLPR